LFLLTFDESNAENVKFILILFCLFISVLSYSQSYRFTKKEDVRKKILGKTSTVALNFCQKKLKSFKQIVIVDTTFEEILVRQTIADSVQKIDFIKEEISKKIESNLRLIERIKLNSSWYPLKKEIYDKEIESLDEDVLKLVQEITRLTTIRIQLLETKNMDEIDYYKVTYIGDSKNQSGEPMFWYTTVFYEPDGQIKIVNFDPE
jgi:hypothetical protein